MPGGLREISAAGGVHAYLVESVARVLRDAWFGWGSKGEGVYVGSAWVRAGGAIRLIVGLLLPYCEDARAGVEAAGRGLFRLIHEEEARLHDAVMRGDWEEASRVSKRLRELCGLMAGLAGGGDSWVGWVLDRRVAIAVLGTGYSGMWLLFSTGEDAESALRMLGRLRAFEDPRRAACVSRYVGWRVSWWLLRDLLLRWPLPGSRS